MNHPPALADKAAYTITAFCELHSISKPFFHKLQKAGQGPATIRLGRKRLITQESAAAWRKQLEA